MKSIVGLAGVVALLQAVSAAAQPFPTKPIQVIVAFPPGGRIDLVARQVAQKMTENLGQPLVIVNKPGGNTNIAAEFVARAPADGYTVFHCIDSTLTINPALYEKLPFDPIRDFAPISRLVLGSSLLVANARLPIRTARELFEHAKSNPGKINYGATSPSTQLTVEQFKSATGVNIVHIPYKGTAQLVQALVAGEIDFVVDGVEAYVSHIKAGKLRPLATFGSARDILLPDVPTAREAGFPEVEKTSWWGWFAPAGTPRPVVTRLNASMNWALTQPDLKEKLTAFGTLPSPSTPEELAADLKSDVAKWPPMIKAAGIRVE
jgi:tripartite-type tricarboxylate transporter receptor subunit TctC